MAIPYDPISHESVQAEGQRLSEGDTSTVEEWFTSTGISKPVVAWEPAREALVTDPITFLYDYWHGRKARDEVGMRSSDVDPADLLPALGYIMILDILEEGRDFRYRLFGSKIAEIAKFDSTGRRISETKAHPLMKAFFSTAWSCRCMTAPAGSTASWSAMCPPTTTNRKCGTRRPSISIGCASAR